MRKTLALIAIAVLLSVSALAAIMPEYKSEFNFPRRYGVERVTHYDPRVNFARMSDTVYLEPAQLTKYKGVGRGGYAPFYARGTARISSSVYTGQPLASVEIKTKAIPATDEVNSQYEAWLVDLDTGYRLSLGTFTTEFLGTGMLTWTANMYLDPYDTVEVTMEPLDDEDVRPGPLVLVAAMPKTIYFDPAPRQGRNLGGTFVNQ